MSDADQLSTWLLKSRNADGGWSFRRGQSWTEPTALAVLALQSISFSGEARSLGASWLAGGQLSDGGWPPCRSIPTSTWVTSLAVLCLAQEPAYLGCIPKAVRWLEGQVYDDSPGVMGTLQRWLGVPAVKASGSSPWYPGTAGWVIPTALSVMALKKVQAAATSPTLAQDISRSQAYLFTRRCTDGGWNHGGSGYRSENAASYGETTGIALLALHDYPRAKLAPALNLANRFLQHPDSVEGLSWLQIGLSAQGQAMAATQPPYSPRNTCEVALRLIALSALRGNNPLLSQATYGKSA